MSPSIPGRLRGVLPVVSVPFLADWTIDTPALQREIDWQFQAGVDGVVIGMVSEILRMDAADRMALTEHVVSAASGRGPVVVAVSAESTPGASALARHAVAAGVDAVMINPPLLTSAGPDDLLRHFDAVALAAADLPVVVQDASGYIGDRVPIDVMVRLLRAFDPVKIQFKPESVPIGPRLTELVNATDGAARIFEGSGGLALVESHRRGAVGTMPGPDVPWAIVAIWNALEVGDIDRADEVAAAVAALLSHVSTLDSYIAVEKHLLVHQGVLPHARMLGPSGYTIDETTNAELIRLVERLRQHVGVTVATGDTR